MDLLITVVLAGLISCTHAENIFEKVDTTKCFGPFPQTYAVAKFKDGNELNNTNQGAVFKRVTFMYQPIEFIFPYQPGEYYNVMLASNYTDGSSTVTRINWHLRNILNSNLAQAEVHIPYVAIDDTANPDCCVFIVGKQNCRKGSPANTNHKPETRAIAELLLEDCVDVVAASYFLLERYPPPSNPPSKPPCALKKPLLPINLCLTGCCS